jgi:hypothetical protein
VTVHRGRQPALRGVIESYRLNYLGRVWYQVRCGKEAASCTLENFFRRARWLEGGKVKVIF